ncbi:MAG: SRPBCC domain-containing protein [Bacteroidota bacterium]|nr:SRPBCC domain-containing protein [Bacteroidota bacterium]
MKVNFKDSIEKPIENVFNAIVDQNKMVNYFISKADSSLVEGKTVHWEFGDVGAKVSVEVKKIIENEQIVFIWAAAGKETEVIITLKKINDDKTAINIIEQDWELNEENISRVLQQTTGWTDFFCCLKAYLLFNVNLRKGVKLS